MKILRIIARLNVGGPARHVVWLTAGLEGDCQTVLVVGALPQGEEDMAYFALAAGVKPLMLPEMSREISPKDVLATWKLFRLMLRERPDIVHTHTAKAGTVGRIAGLMYRYLTPPALIGKPRPCRLVHTYHGHVFHSYYGPVKTRLVLTIERLLARLATDRIIVVSEQQRREINELFHVGRREQFAVIPLGVEMSVYENWTARRARLRDEIIASDSDVLVGIVGRLTRIKNHALFLQTAARFKEINAGRRTVAGNADGRRVRFLVIGDGSLRGELESQARGLGLGDDVLFLGTRQDPEYFYPALDVVALSSLNEGMPLTLIEAMANARPVIATAVGGVIDLVGMADAAGDSGARYSICERGVLVRRPDSESFARGLARLIEDEGLRRRLGECGREFVLRNYAKKRLLSDISKLYRQLAGNIDRSGKVRSVISSPLRHGDVETNESESSAGQFCTPGAAVRNVLKGN